MLCWQTSPEKLQASYSKLQTWICSALETYKQELLSISFPASPSSFTSGVIAAPARSQVLAVVCHAKLAILNLPPLPYLSLQVFVHCFLQIMQADGGNKHATSFFKTWSADHSEHFPTEVRSLAMVTKKDQIKVRRKANGGRLSEY